MPTRRQSLAKDLKVRNFELSHFNPDLQPAIARDIANHCRLAELLAGFPALLAAIARMDNANPIKRTAIGQIEAGASVFAVASTLGLARWTSYLAPAAVSVCTPHPLPDDPPFNAEIINFMPAEAKVQRVWLEAIASAYHWGGPAFALWLARHIREGVPPPPADAIQLIALYFRVAQSPETRLARMMQKRWHAKQSFQNAAIETHYWLSWVILHVLLGPRGQVVTWRENGTALGHRFVAMTTAEEFKSAAEASDNCLYKHAPVLLRDDGNSVYNIFDESTQLLIGHVEIGLDAQRGNFLRPFEMRGCRNRDLDDAVVRAVYAWLATAQHLRPESSVRRRGGPLPARRARIALPSIPDVRVAQNWTLLFDELVRTQGALPDWPDPPTMRDMIALHSRNIALRELASHLDDMFADAIGQLQRLIGSDDTP